MQEFRSSGVQEYQEYRSSGVQELQEFRIPLSDGSGAFIIVSKCACSTSV